MQNPRLAARYAKSLLDLALEQNRLEETLKDVQLLDNICSVSNEFRAVLNSPIIGGEKKLSVIKAVAQDALSPLTVSFVTLLVTKTREESLPEMLKAFIAAYNDLKNIKTVKLATAVAMDDKMRQALLDKISSLMPDATVQLETSVDSDLIGGFVLQSGDKLFDASIRKKLHDMRTNIMDSSYISKM